VLTVSLPVSLWIVSSPAVSVMTSWECLWFQLKKGSQMTRRDLWGEDDLTRPSVARQEICGHGQGLPLAMYIQGSAEDLNRMLEALCFGFHFAHEP
jgi:hypothetical protein